MLNNNSALAGGLTVRPSRPTDRPFLESLYPGQAQLNTMLK